MHSSVFLNTQGEVIRPALLWSDGRTTAECREITERVGGEARLRDLASNPALEGFTLPKVLWLRNHEHGRLPSPCDRSAREGLRSLSSDRRVGDGAVRCVGDADVRHHASALERGDSRGGRSVEVHRPTRRGVVGRPRPRDVESKRAHRSSAGNASRWRRCRQRVRCRRRRSVSAWRSRDELGHVGHSARAVGRAGRGSSSYALTRSVTSCRTRGT